MVANGDQGGEQRLVDGTTLVEVTLSRIQTNPV